MQFKYLNWVQLWQGPSSVSLCVHGVVCCSAEEFVAQEEKRHASIKKKDRALEEKFFPEEIVGVRKDKK